MHQILMTYNNRNHSLYENNFFSFGVRCDGGIFMSFTLLRMMRSSVWIMRWFSLSVSLQRGVNTDSGSTCREASFEGISQWVSCIIQSSAPETHSRDSQCRPPMTRRAPWILLLITDDSTQITRSTLDINVTSEITWTLQPHFNTSALGSQYQSKLFKIKMVRLLSKTVNKKVFVNWLK